ncbi:HU family DNA-binding protein [Thalassovita aquimarina]|uniref:HU family DNA-binding protein n=1 Tax=Thalassovita aquimarina TaxID=2785917 RepID=A0ABS5HSS5_9RHOB|nr:HU family DNA-binding protein [Thalassovita aquimarina]MBR9652011.1 HU family DNA-binding protein [Thalassovita aquimarina]
MARATTKSTAAKPRGRTAATTTPKTPAVRRAAAKPAAGTPKPVVISETTPVSDELELRKAELIEMVVARSDVKKRYAKPVIEAALEILGEALADGREMNLKPLGKVKVNRLEQLSNARVLTCRVRQTPTIKFDANDPLAEAAE